MKIFRTVVMTLAALAVAVVASATTITPMREVRNMLSKEKMLLVEQDLFIEGYIVSQPGGHNSDLNTQRNQTSLRNTDLQTVYIESLNGDVGFRIKLQSRKYAPKFPRYAKVVLSLKNSVLRLSDAGGVTVQGITDTAIMKLEQGKASDLPVKVKSIGELTADDLYTYVTLRDCEILFKDGALSNVYERYAQITPANKKCKPNKSMDSWPILLHDKDGGSIYAIINTLCRWRRNGNGVPQGAGDMRGVVTNVALPRYGGDVLGKFALFPVDGGDFKMKWAATESNYKSIAEWNWNDNAKEFKTKSGYLASITAEPVLADIGKGELRVNVEGKVTRGKDTNNPNIASRADKDAKGENGLVNYGSLRVTTPAHNWWDWESNHGKGIEISFSTKKAKGEHLALGFSFAAGNISGDTSYGFPVFWNVEYSLDGKQWSAVEDQPKKLRSLPWWWMKKVNGLPYECIEAGMGFTEHLVYLPKSLLGQKRVYVRIIPVKKSVATLGYDYSENGALRPNSTKQTVVNFGSIVVRYN